MLKRLKEEPALVRTAVASLLALLVALGVITADLSTKVLGAVAAVLAFFPIGAGIAVRAAVTPVTKAVEVAATAATQAATDAVEAVSATTAGAVGDLTDAGEAIADNVAKDVVRDTVGPLLKAPVDLIGNLPIFRR